MRISASILFLASIALATADDWTASDGTIYKGVKVLSHDDGYVTIMDSDGGGKVPLRLLSPDLQKQFGFNAAKAAACEAATVALDKADRQALVKEQEAEYEAQQKKEAAVMQQPATQVATTQTAPTAPAPPPEPAAQPDSAPASPPKPAMEPEERRQLQEQIANLQSDIDFMQAQEAKLHPSTGNEKVLYSENGSAHEYSNGGYADKIKDDQNQVQTLQQQLNGN